MGVARTSTGDFLWAGGEFTQVNGVAQQGLTRFGTTDMTTGPSQPALSVTSVAAGAVRVAWRASFDADDPVLTYNVYRDGGGTPVFTTSVSSVFWNLSQSSWRDTSVSPGTVHQYRVSASDGRNVAVSALRTVTVARSDSAYAAKIIADGATTFLRYDEPADTFFSDTSSANDNVTARSVGAYLVTPAAIVGDSSRALTMNGALNSTLYSEAKRQPSSTYALETWFRTTTTTGGKIIGLSSKQTLPGTTVDKQVYMTNTGALEFVVSNGSVNALLAPKAYNDGAWHHVVASQGSGGMALYVDGIPVAHNSVATSLSYGEYWRIGGDDIPASFPNKPTSNFWAGSLDETAIYPTALAARLVNDHYVLAGYTPAVVDSTVNVSPDADTYANRGAPTTNFGSSSQLSSGGGTAESFLRFRLPAAPTGTTLSSARLDIRTNVSSTSGSLDSHSVTIASDAWEELSLTWANRPAVGTSAIGTIPGGTAPNTAYSVSLDPGLLSPLLGTVTSLGISASSASTDSINLLSFNTPQATSRPTLVLTFTASPAG